MEHIRQRFSKISPRNSFIADRQEDAQESLLGEDIDAFRKSKHDSDISLRLKLSDSNNDLQEPDDPELMNNERPNEDDDIFSQDDPPNRGQTVFEVISTETVKEGRTSFVLYKILLTRSGVVDDTPCVIQRRYSDFEKLHSSLKKHYPTIMKQVSFPKKVFSGNFTPETIATRSRSFEQFLGHLYSIDTIRFCNLFKEFFYAQDLGDAYRYLSEESYFKATSLFLKVMPAQEMIVGEFGMDVGATACALTASYMKLDEKEIALKYGLLALRCLKTSENSSLYVPLLNTCVHLCWVLGRDKQTLETKLFQLVPKETNIPELLDLILEERRTDETS